MTIIYDSPFTKKDCQLGSKYYASNISAGAYAKHIKPALERILDEDLEDWKSFKGDIILKGIKSTGNIKIIYTNIPDIQQRNKVKNSILNRTPFIY